MPFAAKTRVPVEKTQLEIAALLKKFGAKGFASGWQGDSAQVEFLCRDRHIRFRVKLGTTDQLTRAAWRLLFLLIKAKLAAIDAKVVTFDEAFATDIVMPDGKTVWETIREPLRLACSEGRAVQLLGAPDV